MVQNFHLTSQCINWRSYTR